MLNEPVAAVSKVPFKENPCLQASGWDGTLAKWCGESRKIKDPHQFECQCASSIDQLELLMVEGEVAKGNTSRRCVLSRGLTPSSRQKTEFTWLTNHKTNNTECKKTTFSNAKTIPISGLDRWQMTQVILSYWEYVNQSIRKMKLAKKADSLWLR